MKLGFKYISGFISSKNKPHLKFKKGVLFIIRVIFFGFILVYLGYKVSIIGWNDVLMAMPKVPSFYLLFIIIYFTQPILEFIVYRLLWKLSFLNSIHIFLRKRVFNFGVIDYFGDLFFFNWACNNLNYSNVHIFSKIKDVNILSGLSSNLLTIFLIALIFFSGQIDFVLSSNPKNLSYIIFSILIGLIMLLVFIFLNKYLLELSNKIAAIVFSIHTLRLLFLTTLQMLQWTLVLPEIPLSSWLLFLTANMLVTRVPLIPNKDLTLSALNVSLAGYINADITVLTALFLVSGALNQFFNFFIFFITSFNFNKSNHNI
ncbi:MAG: hypothetical protein CBC47_06850 [Alphaproteobacteria bacterium TMED87]|nr:hypothetical protein [Rhodospirillaceae bacterium]OUV08761.1 MAG: hypothetical protein CBC47_06850 [Alphaproteobacteria bacterium TMED87]